MKLQLRFGHIRNNLLISIVFSILSFSANAQVGNTIGIEYKVGVSRFSHAFNTYTSISAVPQESEFKFYSSSFLQNNLIVNYSNHSENSYFKANVEGIFYWIFHHYDKHNFIKSKYSKYDKVESDNTFITTSDDGENSAANHPINGGADYQFIDWDLAFGNENLKVGANFSVGLLGGRTGLGNSLTNTSNRPEVTNLTLGYFQFGPKVILSNYNDLPLTASVGINRLLGFKSSGNKPNDGERRKGVGIDIEAKYYFGDSQFMPYLSFYAEFKRFAKSSDPVPYATGNSGTGFKEIEVPALKVMAVGITVGFVITEG